MAYSVLEDLSLRDSTWVCRNGSGILIRDMTDGHIGFAIAMIKRSPGWRENYLPILEAELAIRGIKGKKEEIVTDFKIDSIDLLFEPRET